jgi:hypothetical protein
MGATIERTKGVGIPSLGQDRQIFLTYSIKIACHRFPMSLISVRKGKSLPAAAKQSRE